MPRQTVKPRPAPALGRGRKKAQPTLVRDEPAPGPSPDRPEDRQNANLTTAAYDQLRNDVLRGRLRPGEKLGSEALRQRFNIGGSPMREALNRLLAEGLVALEAQKGFRVAPVSEAELQELVTARCWIDGAALTEGIRRADAAWEEHLIVSLHRLARTARRGADPADWEDKHRAFHKALVGGCGSRWIIRISEQLFDAAERYRLLAADYVPERNELSEHRAIVDACIDRNIEAAVDLLAKHYGQTYRVIVESLLNEA